MSFASQAKDEIVKLKIKTREEKRAMLCALVHTAGSMTLGRGGVGVQFITENHGVAKLAASLGVSLYGLESSISVSEQDRLSARNTVVKLSGPACRQLLTDAGCFTETEELGDGSIPAELVGEEAELRAFLKGAFLGSGTLNDPKKGYHLEIVCRQESFAENLNALLNRFELNARYSFRKGSYVVYIKEGEKVSDFLTLLGAMKCTLEFEHTRVLRDLSNNLNRQRNFEDANMHKTAFASAQQLLDIETIRSEQGLEGLPPKLRQAAELRINNPEFSLAELAEMAGISKSGLNHRYKKLGELAEDIRLSKGENL